MPDHPSPLTRSDLDRKIVGAGADTLAITCSSHPEAGSKVMYRDGCLRLLCSSCGFEVAKVKVADQG